jgi:pimeloyl-ACP methyl ester carboxylesterase
MTTSAEEACRPAEGHRAAGRRRLWPRLRLAFALPALVAALVGGYVVTSRRRYRTSVAMARDELAAGGTLIETGSGLVEYAETGAGPPILFVHGAGGGYDQALLVAAAYIGSGYRVIAPSRFGYLGTPLPVDGSPAAQADAYAALLDALDLERVVVAAVSDGGPSALQFALRHPDRTAGLIMISAKSQTPPPERAGQTVLFNTLFRSDHLYWLLTTRFGSTLLAGFGMPSDVQAGLTDEQLSHAHQYLRTMHPIGLRRDGIRNDRRELHDLDPEVFELGRISAPTLIVHGERDSLQPFTHARYAADGIPDARLATFADAGHMLVEHEREIRATVGRFLREEAGPILQRRPALVTPATGAQARPWGSVSTDEQTAR